MLLSKWCSNLPLLVPATTGGQACHHINSDEAQQRSFDFQGVYGKVSGANRTKHQPSQNLKPSTVGFSDVLLRHFRIQRYWVRARSFPSRQSITVQHPCCRPAASAGVTTRRRVCEPELYSVCWKMCRGEEPLLVPTRCGSACSHVSQCGTVYDRFPQRKLHVKPCNKVHERLRCGDVLLCSGLLWGDCVWKWNEVDDFR